MFEVIKCNSCSQHFGRKSGSTSARCPHCSTKPSTNVRVSALVENNRELLQRVAVLNLPPALRGQVPTTHSASPREGSRRMSNEERVQEALRRVGADGSFGQRSLAKVLTELEASANAEQVIAQAMEAGLLIQPRPGEWELVKG